MTEDGTYLLSEDTRNFISRLIELIPDIKVDQRALKLAESQQRVADNQALATASYWKGQELLTGDDKTQYRVLEEMSNVNNIINDYLKQKQGELSFDEYQADLNGFDEDYKTITGQLALLWEKLLTTGKTEELNEIIGDLGSYSRNNLEVALKDIGVSRQEDIDLILSSWDESY